MKLVYFASTLLVLMLAKGCGNCPVGEYGNLENQRRINGDGVSCTYVNIMCNGTPRRSAMCGGAKLGGFAIIASHTKGTLSPTKVVSCGRLN